MKLSALEAIDETTLEEALDEIHRLRAICQDIIDVIGTDYAQGAEPNFCLYQIAEIAHRYFKP